MHNERWGLRYQAWRIKRLSQLTQTMSRAEAVEQIAAEEIDKPWRESAPLAPLERGTCLQ